MKYALKRLGFYMLAAAAAIVLNFALPRLMPGDPASTMFARFQGKMQPEAMEALKEAFGFAEGPLLQQFFSYLTHQLSGDLGTSIAFYPSPVADVIGTGLAWTVALTGVAVIISFIIGTSLGAIAAWRRGGWLDSVLPPVLSFIGAFPYFWLSMFALYLFGFSLDWVPLRHAYSDDLTPEFSWLFISDVLWHAFLPALTLVIATLGGWMLSMRNTMISVLGEDYIRMAKAKGLSSNRVLIWYAARNALMPNITGFGMALGFVLSGSLLMEIVFSYPGLGYLLVVAVRNQDYPLMQGLFLAITLAVLLANWLVDLVYLWLEPRSRTDG